MYKKISKNHSLSVVFMAVLVVFTFFFMSGCSAQVATGTALDTENTIQKASDLQENQPTHSDIDYSLERYNLIRRAYWVNGKREKAVSLPCAIERPLGYIVLFSGNATVGSFVVDGKVSSLNSYLTPDSEYYEMSGGDFSYRNKWLADIDGSYGQNDSGIFFFTPDGKYIEWTGTYLYSDIPMSVDSPVVTIEEAENE